MTKAYNAIAAGLRDAIAHARGERKRGRRRRVQARTRHLPIVLTREKRGGLVAECPIIPGCISQGDTREEALANIREAIALCLENQSAEGWQLPEHVEITTVTI